MLSRLACDPGLTNGDPASHLPFSQCMHLKSVRGGSLGSLEVSDGALEAMLPGRCYVSKQAWTSS
eukprot:6628985-Alexandrium_andersonii.AAC.1